jgi:hypothetical protein
LCNIIFESIGAIGARDGHVITDGFEYSQDRAGGQPKATALKKVALTCQ